MQNRNIISPFFQPNAIQFILGKLLQAITDEDREEIKNILAKRPQLLIEQPSHGTVIESQLTWQKFIAKKPLAMAIQRGQLEIVEIMLPYFEMIENGKAEILSQWQEVPKLSKETKAEKVQQYALRMKALIDVIAAETFPNIAAANQCLLQYATRDNVHIDILGASEETKAAFAKFRNELLPEDAISLDDYVDIELLLVAAYKAYADHFDVFESLMQLRLYRIAVIGFIQGLLTRKVAKVFCDGLYFAVMKEKSLMEENLQKIPEEIIEMSSRNRVDQSRFELFCRKTLSSFEIPTLNETQKEKIKKLYLEIIHIIINHNSFSSFPSLDVNNMKVSEPTEAALEKFRNALLPKDTPKLHDNFDTALFIILHMKTRLDVDELLSDDGNLTGLCTDLLDNLQSLLQPEVALNHRTPYYRTSRDSNTGLGYDSCAGIFGHRLNNDIRAGDIDIALLLGGFEGYWPGTPPTWELFNSHVEEKQNKLANIELALHDALEYTQGPILRGSPHT